MSKTESKKAVMGLSGGMDSITLLSRLLYEGYEVHPIIFHYGSKHNKWENKAAVEIVAEYTQRGLAIQAHPIIDVSNLFKLSPSALMKTGPEIPEGHYEDESMRSTVVHGRNLVFASIMASIAESIEADIIALGVHAGDHYIYPDCRPEFISSLGATIQFSTDHKVTIYAPYLAVDKTGILREGFYLPQTYVPPYDLTRTCYKNQEYACGKCGSCIERLEAFENLGLVDPIKYEKRTG